MEKFNNNKGITLISLTLYIILTLIVLCGLGILATNFRKNINNVKMQNSREIEFDKLNLQLLEETRKDGNKVSVRQSNSTKLVFTSGNTYTFDSEEKAIFLNDNITVASNISEAEFSVQEKNMKQILTVNVTVSNKQRSMQYVIEGIDLVIGATIDYHEYIDPNGNAFTTMPSYTSLKTTRGNTDSSDSDSDAIYSVVNNSEIQWIVLGQEENQIKITTKNIVQPISGGYTNSGFTYLILQSQTGYTNFVNELNKIGAVYGHGKYADITKFTTSGGRSFKMEDLGYGALTRTATYTYALEKHSGDTEAKVYRYAANATPDGTSTTGGTHSKFKYMELDASNSTQETEASYTRNELTESNPSVTIYNYIYSGSKTLDTSVSKADTKYWLASRSIPCGVYGVDYCAYYVHAGGSAIYYSLDTSAGDIGFGTCGVRPVVYLRTDVELVYDGVNNSYSLGL